MKNFRLTILNRLSTGQVFALSFITIILIGSTLLSLPLSLNTNVSLIDNIFTALSATCVTGLVTVNTMESYTTFGKFIIILLMQVGGLGLMTFVAVFYINTKNKLRTKEKNALKEYLNKADLSDFTDYLKKIFLFTFGIEGLGALLIMIRFIPIYGTSEGIFNSIFLSISAFCNAGFECFSYNNLVIYGLDVWINIIVMLLIISGGLGFIVWIELFSHKKGERWSLHTKIVLSITGFLIVSGMLVFLILEWNASLQGYSVIQKLMMGLFQSITYRTAGFQTIEFGTIRPVTKLVSCIYMLVGGSPGGCAGGMKTTTFIIILIMVKSMCFDEMENMHIFNRQIKQEVALKAFQIFMLYIGIVFIDMIIFLAIEPMDVMDMLFETVSAVATVGLSCGITASFSFIGKIILMITMFAGRIGPTTIVVLFAKKVSIKAHYKYPNEDILIG